MRNEVPFPTLGKEKEVTRGQEVRGCSLSGPITSPSLLHLVLGRLADCVYPPVTYVRLLAVPKAVVADDRILAGSQPVAEVERAERPKSVAVHRGLERSVELWPDEGWLRIAARARGRFLQRHCDDRLERLFRLHASPDR